MITGKVQRIYVDKGFMFIRDPETGLEYFGHRSAMREGRFEDLQQLATVHFEPTEGPKGLRAEAIRVAQ